MNRDAKRIVKIFLIAALSLFILVYAFFRSTDLIFGVKIKNVYVGSDKAESGLKVQEEVIKITGNAKNAINLIVNGREVSVAQNGDFGETVALLDGYNIISLKAVDKFGNMDEKDYQLIYSAPAE